MSGPNYLKLTPEELERVKQRKKRDEGVKISPEWRLLSEFGYYYGWAAIEAVRNNDIDMEEFNNLLIGARKVWSGRIIDLSTMTYISQGALKSTKPQTFINKGLANFIKDVRA